MRYTTILFFQHGSNDTKTKDGIFDVPGDSPRESVHDIMEYHKEANLDEIHWNIYNTAVEANATGDQRADFYKLMEYDVM